MNENFDKDIEPSLRLPAEWEPVDAVLVAWPHEGTDWAYMLDDARRCIGRIISAISRFARVIVIGPEAPASEYLAEPCVPENIQYVEIDINDTWTRDYGPITCVDADGNTLLHDFKFNGWGLKFASNHDNLATLRMFEKGVFAGRRSIRLVFVLVGL